MNKYFDYNSFFVNAMRVVLINYPPGCEMEVLQDRSDFLKSNRTISINVGRQTGKTTSFIRLGNELSNHAKVAMIVMNTQNKKMTKSMGAKFDILTFGDIKRQLQILDLEKIQYIIIDESEFILFDENRVHDFYKWAKLVNAEFILKT
ncbi:hypothetical protein Aes012_113 [Aeromonas phage Aes012]|uniref:Putative phage protein n=1 Tax=Aeromonas phage Aes012 TaxID=1198014 RepID=I6ZI47_9CAUD|nr:hypothetical protein Aes012_113 [Aeromonas phage Aes012]AFN69743.1 putative phage protein [Aeromonas phage Aes012]